MSNTTLPPVQWPATFAELKVEARVPESLAQDLAQELKMPAYIAQHLLEVYQPLAQYCAAQSAAQTQPYILGVNGAQGTGKSTAAKVVGTLLTDVSKLRVCTLSIDDLYLGREARRDLANRFHPLLATRGVPGTHDLALALGVFDALKSAQATTVTHIPRFNKALDDCEPQENWERFTGKPDVIIFEGWCVGATAQPDSALDQPVNTLEESEDANGLWRRYVNDCLGDYQALFAQLDLLVMLKAPSFDQVLEWRQLQESKLRDSLTPEQLANSKVMSNSEVARFIAHYERLTRWMFAEMPARSNVLLSLDKNHQIATIQCHTP
ncbi:phosphoribulokinase [Gilvimarinus sp. 1_MG-2023]|uniref:phosphoribulokinase n=1 Tax=Gilvimarinus sp. 1_MG-2023 TaxID=3062638 RepID=UPI0026E3A565|nr:phosphoribulokinase [Gilvimarinus sp. 1_MG-2023]MDO6747630.1 phosphoribulokinase [Gilvimarinus sp. 1_MG-2023]